MNIFTASIVYGCRGIFRYLLSLVLLKYSVFLFQTLSKKVSFSLTPMKSSLLILPISLFRKPVFKLCKVVFPTYRFGGGNQKCG